MPWHFMDDHLYQAGYLIQLMCHVQREIKIRRRASLQNSRSFIIAAESIIIIIVEKLWRAVGVEESVTLSKKYDGTISFQGHKTNAPPTSSSSSSSAASSSSVSAAEVA